MSRGVIQSVLTYALIAVICIEPSASEPKQSEPLDVKIIVEKVERVNENEVHFRLSLLNASASPIFLEGRALLLFSEQPIAEKLYLDQWKEGKWHSIAPCLENAPSAVIRLGSQRTINQDRVLTNPLEAPCKERHFQFSGRFRFRLEYFLSERDAKTNERNWDSGGANLPTPRFAASDSFEIPTS